MVEVRKSLPWADGKAIKSEFDVQVLDLLGPKTEADLAPPPKKEKKTKEPKSEKKEDSKKKVAKEDAGMILAICIILGKDSYSSSVAVLVLRHCTKVRFPRFLSGGFIPAMVVNPPERKLAKRTSVQLSNFCLIHFKIFFYR